MSAITAIIANYQYTEVSKEGYELELIEDGSFKVKMPHQQKKLRHLRKSILPLGGLR